MKPYRLINKLDDASDLNKDIALKFYAGKVKSEKYGEATLSGYFLFMYRHGELPSINVKPIEDRAYEWLKEFGLEEYEEYLCDKINVPSIIAYSSPGVDPDILGLYFLITAVFFILDDALLELNQLNANDPNKNQKEMLRLIESLISIVESKGDESIAEVAASIHPRFKAVFVGLAHICRHNFERMDKDEYTHFMRETVDYIRASKWELEYRVPSYSESDFLFIRAINVGMYPVLTQLYLAKGVHISNEIRMHPLFLKYYNNAILHIALSNDVLSLKKELNDNEAENLVLVKCKKYSLQESIYKSVDVVNDLMIELKKDKIKLKSYFPDNFDLMNFIETVEGLVDGYLNWYAHSKRYGNTKFEKYVVEYDCDYDNWLEKIGITNIENMKEPVYRVP